MFDRKLRSTWLLSTLLLFAAGCIVTQAYLPVQAAQPAPPTVTPCQVVNTFGAIEIARCQPENGVSYLINSHGFMLLED